jgi:hypothetical protein
VSAEPITDRAHRILTVLSEAGGTLSTREISKRALGTETRLGGLRNELGNLAWRQLLSRDEIDREMWSITETGQGALR